MRESFLVGQQMYRKYELANAKSQDEIDAEIIGDGIKFEIRKLLTWGDDQKVLDLDNLHFWFDWCPSQKLRVLQADLREPFGLKHTWRNVWSDPYPDTSMPASAYPELALDICEALVAWGSLYPPDNGSNLYAYRR